MHAAAYRTSAEPSETVASLIAFSTAWPLLSAEQEQELARRIERGDLVAKERLVNSNVRLVISIARAHQGRGLPLGDVIQEGMLGLIRAAEKFDWRRGFRFSTYASLWIRQTIQRGIDTSGRTIRIPVQTGQRLRRAAAVERELTATLGRTPTEEEVAEAAQLTPAALRFAREASISITSLDVGVGDDGETTLGDLLVSPEPSPFDELHGDWRRVELDRARAALPERERLVIELRYEQSATLAQVARVLGVSRERVHQIEQAALRRLAADGRVAALAAAA